MMRFSNVKSARECNTRGRNKNTYKALTGKPEEFLEDLLIDWMSILGWDLKKYGDT
jgi:hypothetical protein